MGFYDYANYNSLPDDQKLLWWFDEYLCHDLVWCSNLIIPTDEDYEGLAWYQALNLTTIALVQRYTLYNYGWANGYSDYLYDLFTTTDCTQKSYGFYFEDIETEATITVSGIVEPVILSCLVGGDRRTILHRLDELRIPLSVYSGVGTPFIEFFRQKIGASNRTVGNIFFDFDYGGVSFRVYDKHFIFLSAKDNGRTITIPNFALYSLVVNGVCNVTAPDNYFYTNILQLKEPYNAPKSWTMIDDQLNSTVHNLADINCTKLIIAKPPDTLFNGLFNVQKNAAPANKNYGVNIDYFNLFVITNPAYPIGFGISTFNLNDWYATWLSNPDFYSYAQADAMFKQLLLQTALINPSTSNLRENVRVDDDGLPIDGEGNVTTNPDEYIYDINPDYIEEYVMGLELMVQEIHACLGAGEFAYYMDNGNPQPYKMNMARLLQTFARAYGVAFKPDGSILPVRARVNIPYTGGTATIPDGYARGQFADNEGGSGTGQTGGNAGEERTGIAYQNRCNNYQNLTDDDTGNDVLLSGDIVLCENFLQLFESYLEDLDKGLNWQEMGGGLLPNADGTSYTTFEGMGTLLAEVAYTLSALSSNIQQTHVLALKNNAIIMEVLKGLGLPTGVGTLSVNVGDSDAIGDNPATVIFPQLHPNTVSLHKRLMDVLTTLSVLVGGALHRIDDDII